VLGRLGLARELAAWN